MNTSINHLNYGTLGYKGLSYSRREEFLKCPRKFEIHHALGLARRTDSVTFSFGHACGAGIQEWFKSRSREQAIIAAVKHYSMPWEDPGSPSDQRAKKSVWYAIQAIETFCNQYNQSMYGGLQIFQKYQLCSVFVDGKLVAGIELEFHIQLDHGFVYEGHIDLVLSHVDTGEFLVVELKHTSLKEPHPAQYSNSDQALGYSIVVDAMAASDGRGAQASYKVAYLIFSSSEQKWILMEFTKTAKQRLNFINNILRDVDRIHSYQEAAETGIPYPTNGSACFDFFKPCDLYNLCGMENANLLYLMHTPDKSQKAFVEESKAHFVFTMDQVIDMQIALAETRTNTPLIGQVGDMQI